MRAPLSICLLAASALLMSGCVAAALPVLAAGGLAAGRGDRAAPEVSVAAAQQVAPDVTPADVAPATVAPVAIASGLPPPSLAGEVRAQVIDPARFDPVQPRIAAYDQFATYVAAQGALPESSSERRSALLVSPGTLRPATKACAALPAAVLIDLDPGESLLDPSGALRGDPLLAGTLASLRAQGITVAWTTANTADQAGAVRKALIAAGLDPAGRDELVLLRYPHERKQTRLADFAAEFCVVALAGDERADFDELFQYLKNPAAAAPLEALIGKGWFLIPQPLTSPSPS